jgi:simple sugar transport system ATP-binding protein
MAYLELRGITKRFPGVLANDDVYMSVERGEVHALVGENGAGKTTLMRILYGLERPDAGEVWVGGRQASISGPADAIRLGVGMVHQHFQLVPSMSVLENVVLGAEPSRLGVVDRAAALRRVQAIAGSLNIHLPWHARVADLSLGPRQRVEILKALYREASILIFDEPTTVLTAQEVQELFMVLRRLAGEGATIILITHKLHEVMAVSERVTVMRHGRVVGVLHTAHTDPRQIARLMVGEEVRPAVRATPPRPGEEVLSAHGLRATDARGAPALRGLSLSVRRGEIVGIAGVEGNGQHELVQALAGLAPVGGTVRLAGHDATHLSTRRRREMGLALIPGDRNAEGLSRVASVAENLASTCFYRPPLSRMGLLDLKAMAERAVQLVRRFSIAVRSIWATAGTLSGGNAQKLVVARELSNDPQVLIAAYPTRGVDVRSAELIRGRLLDMRERGRGVLLISEDLSELLSLSDRVLVLYEGRIVGEFPADRTDPHRLGELMLGEAQAEGRGLNVGA